MKIGVQFALRNIFPIFPLFSLAAKNTFHVEEVGREIIETENAKNFYSYPKWQKLNRQRQRCRAFEINNYPKHEGNFRN